MIVKSGAPVTAAFAAQWERENSPIIRHPLLGIRVLLPIRTRNPLNGSMGNSMLAALIRSRERAKHHGLAYLVVAAALKSRGLTGIELVPVVVTLTRISTGKMDDDGLAGSCKGIRDGIAQALGIDDGDRARLRYRYAQRKGKRGVHAVECLIEQGRVTS